MRLSQNIELRWLAVRVKPFLRLHLSSYLCILLSSFLVLLDPLIVRFLIDEVIPNRRVSWLPLVAIAFLFTYLARLGSDNLAGMLNFRAVQKMIFRSRLSLLRHLQRLSAEYHDNRPLGDTLYRLQIDVDQVGTLSGEVIPSALRMVTVFTLVMTTMLVLNYRLTIIVLPLVPVFILVRTAVSRSFAAGFRLGSGTVRQSDRLSRRASLVDRPGSTAFVRAARSAPFCATVGWRRASTGKTARHGTVFQCPALLHHHHRHGERALLWWISRDVGTTNAGRTSRLLWLHAAIFIPLYGVVDIYSKLQRAGASIRRLMEITEADAVLRDRPGALALQPGPAGVVELKDVSFGYQQSDRPVLNAVSLRVNAGERVALSGRSGNGKSTIARLLARLYDARSGSVLIEGLDVRDVKLKSLRSSVIFVPQDPVLFDLTLRENLLYGNTDGQR